MDLTWHLQRTACLSVGLLAMAACSGNGNPTRSPAGSDAAIDVGNGGTGVSSDAGNGPDANRKQDAGNGLDAGSEPDASHPLDGGDELDAGSAPDAGDGQDTGTEGDAGSMCDRTGFVSRQEESTLYTDGASLVVRDGNLASPPYDGIFLEVLVSDLPNGTYALNEPTFADSAISLNIQTGCTSDAAPCEKFFLATEGSLIVTDVGFKPGDNFIGELSNIVLQEATIDWDTFKTKLVNNGETWCLEKFSFAHQWEN